MFWFTAFVLIVLFWVELQTQVQRMQGIEKLKPYLIGVHHVCVCHFLCLFIPRCFPPPSAVLVTYGCFRFLTLIANLWAPKLSVAANLLTILVYLSLMIVGQYYGQQLLKKMKQMSDKEFKAQLMKLTLFIILENAVLVALLICYVIRTFSQGKAKFQKPWEWFWLKLLEKTFETMSIIVLSLTMLGDSKKGAAKGGKTSSTTAAPIAGGVAETRRKKKVAAAGGGDNASPAVTANPLSAAAALPGTPTPAKGDGVDLSSIVEERRSSGGDSGGSSSGGTALASIAPPKPPVSTGGDESGVVLEMGSVSTRPLLPPA